MADAVVEVERPNGDTKTFTFSEIQNGSLVSWVTANDASADGMARLLNGSGATVSTPDAEKPKIVKGGSLVEDFARGILDFDGSDDGYVYDVQSRSEWTVAVRADPQGSVRQTLIEADGLLVYATGSGTVKARITDGTTTKIASLSRHKGVMNVLASVDSSTVALHVGGETATTSHSISRNQTGKVAVGKESDGTYPIQGYCSDAFAWGRFFSVQERSQTFRNQLRRYGPLPAPWQEQDLQNVERGKVHQPTKWPNSDGVKEPEYYLDFPVVQIIPQAIKDGWSRSSAARFVNTNGLYAAKSSGLPRLQYAFGGGPSGVLVEAYGFTNHALHSADISQWGTSATTTAAASTIISGETALEVTGNSTNSAARVTTPAGSLTNGTETAVYIIERGTSDVPALSVRDKTAGAYVFRVRYDWTNDSFTVVDGAVDATYSRTLTTSGPNGKKVVEIVVRYSGATSGNSRGLWVHPDHSETSSTTFVHFGQLMERGARCDPIVTGASATTRAADTYNIFSGGQPSWWNTNEGTWLLKFIPQIYESSGPRFLEDPTNSDLRILYDLTFGAEPFKVGVFDGVNRISVTGASAFTVSTAAVSLSGSEMRLSLNGSSTTGPHNGDLLTQLTDLQIGRNHPSVVFGRLHYFPKAFSASTLNTLTS